MVQLRHVDDIPLFEKWALCTSMVGDELWVGSMAGLIVALDSNLTELRRWQAHNGSVNGILSDGTTYGVDGLVKDQDGKTLAGPFKKPVSKVQRMRTRLFVGTYERTLYENAHKETKIAAWHVMSNGWRFSVPKIGPKTGDLGPTEYGGKQIAPPAWSLSAGPTDEQVYAYFKSGGFALLNTNGSHTFFPGTSKEAPSSVVHFDNQTFLIGNYEIRVYEQFTLTSSLRFPMKGLYSSTHLPDGRLVIAAADGNLKVIEIAA